jgi:hypothetical protein
LSINQIKNINPANKRYGNTVKRNVKTALAAIQIRIAINSAQRAVLI